MAKVQCAAVSVLFEDTRVADLVCGAYLNKTTPLAQPRLPIQA